MTGVLATGPEISSGPPSGTYANRGSFDSSMVCERVGPKLAVASARGQGEGRRGNPREAERDQGPAPVSLRWQRFVELALSRLDGHSLHRRLAQPRRKRILISLLILKLDDA